MKRLAILFLIVSLTPSFAFAALADNITAYYKLDETSGIADDAVATFDLTNTNTVAYSAGKINNAADTGSANTNKKLDTTAFLGLVHNTSFSVNLWVNVTTNPANAVEAHMYSWADNSTVNQKIYNHLKFYNNGGTMQYYIARNNGDAQTQIGANSGMNTGTWYMLTWTWDGTTQNLYKDGNSTAVLSQASAITGTNTANGGTDGTKLFTKEDNTVYLSGLLDEVGVWSRALSTAEISELYNSGSGVQYPFATASAPKPPDIIIISRGDWVWYQGIRGPIPPRFISPTAWNV